jgi:thiamine-monophosphate kinase
MGGEPAAAFLSLAFPSDLSRSWVGGFVRGLMKLAAKYGATLAGGDTAQSPDGILADIVVLGTVPKGKAVLRSGARPGDLIYVTGRLGGSAAAIGEMRKKTGRKPNPRYYARHFFPEPRIEVGRILRERGLASAMIDTSDGLSTDLAHICEESGVGAEVQARSIPRAKVYRPAEKADPIPNCRSSGHLHRQDYDRAQGIPDKRIRREERTQSTGMGTLPQVVSTLVTRVIIYVYTLARRTVLE